MPKNGEGEILLVVLLSQRAAAEQEADVQWSIVDDEDEVKRLKKSSFILHWPPF